MGIGWVLDHISPLKEWLNHLTGDAGAVLGAAQTWANISAQHASTRDDVTKIIRDLSAMSSLTTTQACATLMQIAQSLDAVAELSSAFGVALQVASSLVQVVHDLVRDAIADIVGVALAAVAETIASGGLAIPLVIAQVQIRVSAWATKLSKNLIDLVNSFRNLSKLFNSAGKNLRDLRSFLDELMGQLSTRHGRENLGRNLAAKVSESRAERELRDAAPHMTLWGHKVMSTDGIPIEPLVIDDSIARQGALGDCYLIAGILALAEEWHHMLRNRIVKTVGGYRFQGSEIIDMTDGIPVQTESPFNRQDHGGQHYGLELTGTQRTEVQWTGRASRHIWRKPGQQNMVAAIRQSRADSRLMHWSG